MIESKGHVLSSNLRKLKKNLELSLFFVHGLLLRDVVPLRTHAFGRIHYIARLCVPQWFQYCGRLWKHKIQEFASFSTGKSVMKTFKP